MEETKSFLGWSFDDIVFFGRNKDYGAYELRKDTKKNSIIGIIAAGAAAILLTSMSCTVRNFRQRKSRKSGVSLPKALVSI